jgi:hypothetical protein
MPHSYNITPNNDIFSKNHLKKLDQTIHNQMKMSVALGNYHLRNTMEPKRTSSIEENTMKTRTKYDIDETIKG